MEIPLDKISIAKPCTANWADMSGDERVRHCGLCKKNVYNLAGLKADEIQKVLGASDGRMCIRFYQRADGTMLTEDCPVGLAKLRKRLALLSGALAASLFLAAGSVLARMGFQTGDPAQKSTPSQSIETWLKYGVTPRQVVMGDWCPPVKAVAPPAPPPPAPAPVAPNPGAQTQ
jgi:hypothetical protein